MAHRWWGMVLALGTLISSSAVAQVRQVTGTGVQRRDRSGCTRGDNRGARDADRGPERDRRPLFPQRTRWHTDPGNPGDRVPLSYRHLAAGGRHGGRGPRAGHLQSRRGRGDRPVYRHREAEPAERCGDGERKRAHPGADRHARERAPGQDPGRVDPVQLRRAGRRHPGQPPRRLDDQRGHRPAVRGRWDRDQQRRDSQRRRRGDGRPRRAATPATRTTRPTASPTSTPRTSSGSKS